MMLRTIDNSQSRKREHGRVPYKLVSRLVAIVAAVGIPVLPATEVDAGQRCWPLDEVLRAHEKQGDEILVIFSSWIRDGAYTIIFQDPSDGVVTEVAVDGPGVACIFDVGDRLRDHPTFADQSLGLN